MNTQLPARLPAPLQCNAAMPKQPEDMASTDQGGTLTAHPHQQLHQHIILKGKHSHQQSPQLCNVSTHCHSLQNLFVYCYRMQDKGLKSTPITELLLNKLT